MSSDAGPIQGGRLPAAATVASALLIPFPILVSGLVKAAAFAGNPADVDITNDLAYLREILVSGFVSLGVILVVIVVLLVLTYRQARSFAAIRLPLIVFGLQIVLGLVILLFAAISNNAVDTYAG